MDDFKDALGTSARERVPQAGRARVPHQLLAPGAVLHLGRARPLRRLGLWSFRQVWFSRFGTLVPTVELVVSAEAGYDAAELEAVLNVEAKAALLKLATRVDRHLHR